MKMCSQLELVAVAPPGEVRDRSGAAVKNVESRSGGMSLADLSMCITLSQALSNNTFSLLLGQTCETCRMRSWRCSTLEKLPAVVFLKSFRKQLFQNSKPRCGEKGSKCFQSAYVIGGMAHLLEFYILVLMSNYMLLYVYKVFILCSHFSFSSSVGYDSSKPLPRGCCLKGF